MDKLAEIPARYKELMLWTDRQSVDEFGEMVCAKRVALVGGGPFTAGGVGWKNYDVLVGVNAHFLKEDGLKYDVVYWNNTEVGDEVREWLVEWKPFMQINIPADESIELAEFCEEHGIRWCFWGANDVLRSYQIAPDSQWPVGLMEAYNCNPLTGTSAVYHLLSLNCRKLFVTGMDFYSSITGNGMPPQWIGIHEVLPQIKYLRDLLRKGEGGRLVLDAKLMDLVGRYNEFCGEIEQMAVMPDNLSKEPIFPGEKIDMWSPMRFLKLMVHIRQSSPQFFDTICELVERVKDGEIRSAASYAEIADGELKSHSSEVRLDSPAGPAA